MNLCPICLESIESRSCMTVCNHEFHTSCLLESIVKSNNTCPVCRTKLVEKIQPITIVHRQQVRPIHRTQNTMRRNRNRRTHQVRPLYEIHRSIRKFLVFITRTR